MSQIISFPGLGFSVTIDPNALCIGDFCIKWYGVLFAAAFLCGTLYAIKNAKKFGLDEDRMLDVLLGAIVCGVIGARLYYVLTKLEDFSSFKEVINIRNGGLAIYGGIIAGRMAVLAEGDAQDRADLIYLEKLPLFNADGSVK